jgi:pimeloyl-ACP methyl ester carboxylesterase
LRGCASRYSAYHYDLLQGDIFSLVDASGLAGAFEGRFHVVAHDQGARVAWHSIATGAGRSRFQSLASLSIPHGDVFSDALMGSSPDPAQQQASQYVRELVLPNSTTFDQGQIFGPVCASNGFATPADCQKTLWWYNGAIDSGSMALGPMQDYEPGSIAASIGIPAEDVAAASQYPLDGVVQTAKVGNVTEFPVFYGCGGGDTADLCEQAFADQSGALVQSAFSYLKVASCGHDVLGCSYAQAFIEKVVANILSVY